MSDRDQLERDLRAAAHDFDDVVASPAAWQENQQRLAAHRSRRTRLGGAAAAGVVAVALVGVALLRGGDPGTGVPAAGGDDPFATPYLLAGPVTVETVTIGGTAVAHEVALSDRTGEGPQLCDRFVGVDGTPSCTPRAVSADDPEVALDWLTGYGPESPRRGIVAAVDERVSSLDLWMSDGRRVRGDLRPGGWDRSRVVGLTVAPGTPVPQRLVAYGRDGNVLQSVDLIARFGDRWLDQRSACASDPVAELSSDGEQPPHADVAFGTTDALVTARPTADHDVQTCLGRLRGSAIAGQVSFGSVAVAVLAPETELVEVRVGSRTVAELKPLTASGTPWRVVVLRGLSVADLSRAELLAYDLHGLELDRVYVSQPMTP